MKKFKKKVVLLLHGFPGLTVRNPILKYFIAKKYDLYIPDLFNLSYKFISADILKSIKSDLKGKEPDVIVGVSLGGLLAPLIARKYPDAKLIMIATGPRLEVSVPVYNFCIYFVDYGLIGIFSGLAKKIPTSFYKVLYKTFNPFLNKAQIGKSYEQNILETFEAFKKIPNSKILEIVKFIRQNRNNGKLLQRLKNKTLIIAGSRDIMMPRKLSVELKSLIKNSVLIENTNRLHYDVFDKRDFNKLDLFLGN